MFSINNLLSTICNRAADAVLLFDKIYSKVLVILKLDIKRLIKLNYYIYIQILEIIILYFFNKETV